MLCFILVATLVVGLISNQYSEDIVYTINSKITSFFGISSPLHTENVGQLFDVGYFHYWVILLFLTLLVSFVLFLPKKKISEVSQIRSFLSFTLITILFTSAAVTPLSIASTYWSSAYADEMNATESVNPSELTATEPAPEEQSVDTSNPDTSDSTSDDSSQDDISATTTPVGNSTTTLPAGNSTSPSAEEPTSADISATTTPVGNSTTTLPAGNSTSPSAEEPTSADISATTTPVGNSTTTLPAGNSTSPSAEEPTSQTESVPDNSTSNEITQPLPDATLSLQFDDSTQTSDVAGDATVEEELDVTSLNLDGEGDFVQVTDTGSSRELTAMSLLAWVKPDYNGGSSEFTVVSKDKAFVLAINNNIPPYKIAKFSVYDGIKWSTVESTTQIKEEWTHLAATFDGLSIGIYVNGNLESTLPITGVPSLTVNGQLDLITADSISSDSDIVIGAYLSEKSGHSEISNQFSGLVGNVHLYDSLLQLTQISDIYNQDIISYYSSEAIEDFTLEHDAIEIGKPVTWTQNVVMAEQTESVAVEVPADAQIIQVETSTGESVDLSTIKTTTQSAVLDNQVPVASLDLVSEMVQEEKPTELVIINETATDYTVTFETPAPYTIEEDQSIPELYSKEVTVAHDSALHYTEVKSYSDIPEDLVAQGAEFKLYWIIDGEKTDVTADPRFAVEFVDINGNGIADQIQWIVPQLSEQQFVIEAQLTVINVQSYPVVGGNWIVSFTTTGTADLVITAIDGTTFGDSLPADLKFLELNNGTHILTPTLEGNSIIYRGYSSTAEGFETSQVLTSGKHHLEFRFGTDIDYAYNLATDPLEPIAIGNLDEWTLGVGTDKVSAVLTNDGDTSYIKANTGIGNERKQTFMFEGAGVPTGSTIISVTVYGIAKKVLSAGSTGPNIFELIVGKQDFGSIDAGGGDVSLTTTYQLYNAIMQNNPFTGQPWTPSEVNTWISGGKALSFGGKRQDATTEPRVTQYFVTVEYTAPPVAQNDAYSVNEDTTLTVAAAGVLVNDSDPDGNPLTAIIVSSPSNGILTLNSNGGFTYTPNLNYNGPDSFTYKANDGAADSNVATVSLTINAVNNPPVAQNDSYSVNEDTTLTVAAAGVLANDPDVESNPLTAIIVSSPSNGILTLNSNGGFTYTPNLNYNGPDSFTYKANDGAADSNVATVSLTINAVNDPPVALNDAYSTEEDTALTIAALGVLANDGDIDNNPLTAIIVSSPSNGILTLNSNGGFTYTPNLNYNGPDSFTYKANDGAADSNVATVSLTIGPINDPPVAQNDSYSVNEDTTLTVAAAGVLANDPDVESNPLTAIIVSSPSNGILTLNSNGGFTYTPNLNYNGPDSFTYQASDGLDNSNVATVTLTVGSSNDPPVLGNIPPLTVLEATPATFTATASDPDPLNTLTFSLIGAPTGASINSATGVFSWTPTEAQGPATYTFTVQVSDGALTDTQSVTITVNQLGPNIISLTATDPQSPSDGQYGVGDKITIKFSEDTNKPPAATKAEIDAHYTFSQNLGANYVGFYTSPSSLEITITDANGATPPTIGGLQVIVTPAANLKNIAGTSLASTPTSPPLVGSFGVRAGPSITEFSANDPNGLDAVYGNGDTITIRFSEATNRPGGTGTQSKAAVDSIFTFTQNGVPISLGNSYTGQWVTTNIFRVTITDATGHGSPQIGLLAVTVKSTANLKNAAATSLASIAVSHVLTGSFGSKPGPFITGFLANDPSGLSAAYGNGDTLTITFSEATNRPSGTGIHDKATVDSIFTFKQSGVPISLGNSYTGTWISTTSYRVTITDATGNGNPQISLLTATVNAGANLKNSVGKSLVSTSTSQTLTGTFASPPGPSIIEAAAANPNNSGSFENGVTVTIRFSEPTNQPSGDVDSIFAFSQGLGAIHTGQWIAPDKYKITIVDATGNGSPQIGVTTVTVNAGANLKNSAGNSLASTSSQTLAGSFGTPPGPSILALVAADPDSGDAVFGSLDTITIRFSESTNRPDPTPTVPGLSTSDINTMLTFVQGGLPVFLGTSYIGIWTSTSTLIITAVDTTGATPPTIGGLTVTVNAGANLKNSAGTSLSSTSTSPPLIGSFGNRPGPYMIELVASDPDSGDAVYGNFDTLTIQFSESTNRPDPTPTVPGLSTSDLNNLVTFSQNLGTDYTGTYTNPSTLVITIQNSAGATPPAIGELTVTLKESANLKNSAGTSLSSTSTSPPLIGSFGNRPGPFVAAFVADDPDSGDAVYGNFDTLTIQFSESTNRPDPTPTVPGLSTSDLNNLVTFSQNLGTDYTGTYTNPSTLVITIQNSAGATPPAIGELTVTLKESANLKNSADTSLASTSTSPILSGSFGLFTAIISLGDGGTATAVMPSGISASITLPSGVEGTIEITRSEVSEGSGGASLAILGTVAEITPSEGASCTLGCPITFEFTQDQADEAGINPFEMKILHDANEDGVFDSNDPNEFLDATVTQTGPETFLATVTVNFNSKFSIGGFRGALLLGGLSDKISASPTLTGVTFSSHVASSSGELGFGGILESQAKLDQVSTRIIQTKEPLVLKLHLHDDGGYSTIQHVALYTNLHGLIREIENSDTSIIYERNKPVQITDPNGLFANVTIATSKIENNLELVFNMTFAKQMETSDIIIRSWDNDGNSRDSRMRNALQVVLSDAEQNENTSVLLPQEQTVSVKIPAWIKTNTNWWSEGKIGDSDFVQGIQYLIKEGIITIPETESGSGSSQQIPLWIKNNAGWWAEGLISDADFISTIQWLITDGIMKV